MSKIVTVPTIRYDIFMAGDVVEARKICRRFCFEVGFCVHVEPVYYVYKGGEEYGFKVGLINYPRFPMKERELWNRAMDLAKRLMIDLNQLSFSLVGDKKTEWFSRREE